MVYSIIRSFDVWTDAQGVKSKGRVKSIDNISFEGIAHLRELILELAIRGKLVSQNPADEPASELLKRIEKEKVKLINDGKLKQEKPFPSITDDEMPFEVPAGWEWTRLINVGNIFNGNSINSSVKEAKYTNNKGIPFIATKDVGYGWEKLDYDNGITIPENEESFKMAHKGAVLICAEGGSAGKKCGIAERNIFFGNKLFAIELFGKVVPEYILSNYLSFSFSSQFTSQMAGIIGGISVQKFINLKIPLPPLAEQYRIVTKVEELMALSNELEKEKTASLKTHQTLVGALLQTLTGAKDAGEVDTAWHQIAPHFETLFSTEDSIDQLKQTILQLAVMGRLVKQDPNDEPASELLKRIEKEKEKLIKQGKIKKEKPVPEIQHEEKPFALPSGWEFVRLSDLCELITKGSSPKWQGVSYVDNQNEVLFITSENVGNFKMLLENRKYVEQKFNEVEPRSILKQGDFLMNIVGGSIGRTAVFDLPDIANINQAVCLIRPFIEFLNSKYLLFFFNSEICISYMFEKQVDNARANLSMGNISKFVIPIPPIQEQRRIVDKVDELMALCEKLQQRLLKSQEIQNALSKTIVENAIA